MCFLSGTPTSKSTSYNWGTWGSIPRALVSGAPGDTNIQECSSPLYKMMQSSEYRRPFQYLAVKPTHRGPTLLSRYKNSNPTLHLVLPPPPLQPRVCTFPRGDPFELTTCGRALTMPVNHWGSQRVFRTGNGV